MVRLMRQIRLYHTLQTLDVGMKQTAVATSAASSMPPLVFLHGLLGNAMNWRFIGRQFAAIYPSRRIISVNMTNHGASPHDDSFSYESMTEDVALTLHSVLHCQQVDVVGHSMGGKVAMHWALHQSKYPLQPRRLCVVDIAPTNLTGRGGDASFQVLQAMSRLDLSLVKSRCDADKMLLENGITDSQLRAFCLTNLISINDESQLSTSPVTSQEPPCTKQPGDSNISFKWRVNLNVLISRYFPYLSEFNLLNSYQRFEGPTLFMRGEKSTFVTNDDHSTILSLFPNASIETIANAGHWIHSEQPSSFVASLKKFLN